MAAINDSGNMCLGLYHNVKLCWEKAETLSLLIRLSTVSRRICQRAFTEKVMLKSDQVVINRTVRTQRFYYEKLQSTAGVIPLGFCLSSCLFRTSQIYSVHNQWNCDTKMPLIRYNVWVRVTKPVIRGNRTYGQDLSQLSFLYQHIVR